MKMDEKILRTMRSMAWDRAKGELFSMLQTFWNKEENGMFEKLRKHIELFVKDVEDGGLRC